MKESFEKVNFEKKPADDNKSMKNYPACKELKTLKKLKNYAHAAVIRLTIYRDMLMI